MANNQANEYENDVLENSSTGQQTYTDDPNVCSQDNSGDYQYYEGPSMDQWCGVPANESSSNEVPLWRQPSCSQPPLSYLPSEEGFAYMDARHDPDVVDNIHTGAVIATDHGTMTIRLQHRMCVDMTIDKAIRITNLKSNIVMSLSATGASAALLHPNGRIHHYGSRVEIQAHDHYGNNKYAKMWKKGISFTSDKCALVYLVDSAGVRTTSDTFSDMDKDYSLAVFYNESRHGAAYQEEVMHLLQNAQYFVDDKKVQNWIINNVRVSQTPDGFVRVARDSNKYHLRTSPKNGSATVTTPFVHATASLGQASHLFVRKEERRMHYDGTSFIVRYAHYSAGLDDKHRLKVF